MTVRMYTPEDYPMICLWWSGHGHIELHPSMLPKLGVVALSDEGHPQAVAWVYMALEVGVAWLAWITTNPRLKPKESLKALKVLLGGVEAALPKEYTVMFTETKSQGLVQLLKRQGYKVNHAATQLFKGVNF